MPSVHQPGSDTRRTRRDTRRCFGTPAPGSYGPGRQSLRDSHHVCRSAPVSGSGRRLSCRHSRCRRIGGLGMERRNRLGCRPRLRRSRCRRRTQQPTGTILRRRSVRRDSFRHPHTVRHRRRWRRFVPRRSLLGLDRGLLQDSVHRQRRCGYRGNHRQSRRALDSDRPCRAGLGNSRRRSDIRPVRHISRCPRRSVEHRDRDPRHRTLCNCRLGRHDRPNSPDR